LIEMRKISTRFLPTALAQAGSIEVVDLCSWQTQIPKNFLLVKLVSRRITGPPAFMFRAEQYARERSNVPRGISMKSMQTYLKPHIIWGFSYESLV